MNKGFTLIELLGVVIILSFLMILSMPKIVNSVKNSGDEVDNLTSELVINAAELLVDSYKDEYKKINGSKYCVPISDLVEEGYLKAPITLSNSNEDISKKKSVQVSYRDKYKYEIVDNKDCTPVTVFKAVDSNTATYRTDDTTMTVGNIPEGNYEPGDEYIVQVNDTNSYHFYILSSNDDGSVNMIMDSNLINSPWISTEDYKLLNITESCFDDNGCIFGGPVTALKTLNNNTLNWKNIPYISINFVEEGIYNITTTNNITEIKSSEGRIYASYKNLRTRLPKLVEINDVKVDGETPLWIYVNLTDDYENSLYYLFDKQGGNAATLISNIGSTDTISPCYSPWGIRPVITVPKDYLQ